MFLRQENIIGINDTRHQNEQSPLKNKWQKMIKSMIQVIKIQINYILELNRQCAKKEN